MSTSLTTKVELLFGGRCGRPPQGVVFAPGRLVVLGEHLDHQGGPVLTAPVPQGMACAWAVRPDSRVVVWAMDRQGKDSFQHGQQIRTGRGWSDLARGACARAAADGRRLPGIDLMIVGDLPSGEGLASSAAFLVVVLRALFEAVGVYRSKWELAEDVPWIEREWAGVACGAMDPYAVAAAKPGQVLLIECDELNHEVLHLPDGYEFVAEGTGTSRRLAEVPYNERRQELAAALTEIQALRPDVRRLPELTPTVFAEVEAELSEPGRRRARHIVTETARVHEAARALEAGDVDAVGQLMVAGHRSLVEDFESSRPEIDRLVDIAMSRSDVLGARLQGAGWGGRLAVLRKAAGA